MIRQILIFIIISTLPTLHDQADTNSHNYYVICDVTNFTSWKSCIHIIYSNACLAALNKVSLFLVVPRPYG